MILGKHCLEELIPASGKIQAIFFSMLFYSRCRSHHNFLIVILAVIVFVIHIVTFSVFIFNVIEFARIGRGFIYGGGR